MSHSDGGSATDALSAFFLSLQDGESTQDLQAWDSLRRHELFRGLSPEDALVRFAELRDRLPDYSFKKGVPAFPTADVLACLAVALDKAGRIAERDEAVEQASARVSLETPSSVRRVLKEFGERIRPKAARRTAGSTKNVIPVDQARKLLGDLEVPRRAACLCVLRRPHPEFQLHKSGYGILIPPSESDDVDCGVIPPSGCEVLRAFLGDKPGLVVAGKIAMTGGKFECALAAIRPKVPSGGALRVRLDSLNKAVRLDMFKLRTDRRGRRVLELAVDLVLHEV